jgi:hypothetical protein
MTDKPADDLVTDIVQSIQRKKAAQERLRLQLCTSDPRICYLCKYDRDEDTLATHRIIRYRTGRYAAKRSSDPELCLRCASNQTAGMNIELRLRGLLDSETRLVPRIPEGPE